MAETLYPVNCAKCGKLIYRTASAMAANKYKMFFCCRQHFFRSEESKEKSRQTALKLYKDPKHYNRLLEMNKKANSDECRKKSNAGLRKYYRDHPDARKRISDRSKKQFQTPGARERHSIAMIKANKNPETIRRHCEENIKRILNGCWYGNVKYFDGPIYCEKFNEPFKERVRAYWGYKCVECGTLQNGRSLCVHHVHYDKKMCCNGSPHDVVPLCQSCHNATNNNREYWEDHFTEMIYNWNPEGKCFFTKEEMKKYHES